MSKSHILIALALVLTACGSDEGAVTQSTSIPESTGGSATSSTATSTVAGATGGSASKTTGGSSTSVAGTPSTIGTRTTGGSSTISSGTTGGSTGSTTVGGSDPGAGGSDPKASGGSSGQVTTTASGGSSATGGSSGRTTTGGSSSTGGKSSTGGSSTTGGSTSQATGGSTPQATGGSSITATGGSTTTATGGSPATGGSTTTTTATGGSPPSTGGSPATGGSSTTTTVTGGSAPTINTLYEGITVPAGTYPGSESHGIIRTDASNIYWATYRDLSSGHTTYSSIIRKAPKTGGASTLIVTAPSGSVVGDLVVAGGYVYWMEWGKSTGQVKINKATVDGASPTTLTTIASPYGTTRPILLTLRTDGSYLFWVATPVIQYDTTGWASDTFTRIDKVSVNGGAISTLATVTGGSTWDVTLGGDTSVICYKMIVAGEYSPTSNAWWSTARPFMNCSSPTNTTMNMGQIPSFTDAQANSMTGSTTYSNGSVYLHNDYGVSDTLHITAENTLLKVENTGDYLNSDATHLFYLLSGQIYQASLTTWSSQPLAPVTNLSSMASDGTTLFWVDGVNIYSKAEL